MSKTVTLWLEEAALFHVDKDNIVLCWFSVGDTRYEIRGKPKTLAATLQNGTVAFAGFVKRTAADTIKLKPKKGGKHRH